MTEATAEDEHWVEHGRTEAFSSPWFAISRRTLAVPGGGTGEFFVHEGPDAAMCVCVTPAREVLLEWQYRPAIGRVSVDHPAGRIEPDDPDPAAAVVRELAEETGFVASSIRRLGVLDKDPGFSAGALHVFLAEGLVAGAAEPDDTERITVRWVDADEVLAMIDDGRLACAFCVSATYLAFRALGWLRPSS